MNIISKLTTENVNSLNNRHTAIKLALIMTTIYDRHTNSGIVDMVLVVAFFLVAGIRGECVAIHYLPVLFFQRWRSASAHQFHSLHWDRSTESGT